MQFGFVTLRSAFTVRASNANISAAVSACRSCSRMSAVHIGAKREFFLRDSPEFSPLLK
jgi:hypothetical protein